VALAASSWGTWGIFLRRVERIAPLPSALETMVVMAVITLVTGLAVAGERIRFHGSSTTLRAESRASWKVRAWVGWLGVGDALNVLLFFAAYKRTIAVAVLTHYLTPLFVAITAPLVLRERLTSRTATAVAVSLAGLGLMLVPAEAGAPSVAVWTSAALGAGSAVFYASNILVNKYVASAFSTNETMFWHGVVATPLLAAFVPRAAWAAANCHAVALLAAVAIGPGALGGIAFVWGLRRIPAAHASTLTLLEPLVSVALGAAVLGERLGILGLMGGAAILVGAAMVLGQRAETNR
jgi:drug/metabolite transporter (DMT)-like permease